MRESSLTISQLAAHVGVTVRAVRHYHARGLLREPARDTSGYRRYDAQAVIDLIRIKTLAEAGVPLARIRRLLSAPPAQFAAEVTAIDRSLQTRIREMQQNRRRLGELTAGERLFLPAKIVELLDDLRAGSWPARCCPNPWANWSRKRKPCSETRTSNISTWPQTRPSTGILPIPGSTGWATCSSIFPSATRRRGTILQIGTSGRRLPPASCSRTSKLSHLPGFD
jgi:DNA-binding transcriptional MerR regulator